MSAPGPLLLQQTVIGLNQFGATAVTHLVAALEGTPASGVVRQPCRLVVRESTA